MSSDDDAGNLISDMFQDPADYFPPEPAATYEEHTLLSGQTIQLRLVGHNPLWVPTCKLPRLDLPNLSFHPSGTPSLERRPGHFKISTKPCRSSGLPQRCTWTWSWGWIAQSCRCCSWRSECCSHRLSRRGPNIQSWAQYRQLCGPSGPYIYYLYPGKFLIPWCQDLENLIEMWHIRAIYGVSQPTPCYLNCPAVRPFQALRTVLGSTFSFLQTSFSITRNMLPSWLQSPTLSSAHPTPKPLYSLRRIDHGFSKMTWHFSSWRWKVVLRLTRFGRKWWKNSYLRKIREWVDQFYDTGVYLCKGLLC